MDLALREEYSITFYTKLKGLKRKHQSLRKWTFLKICVLYICVSRKTISALVSFRVLDIMSCYSEYIKKVKLSPYRPWRPLGLREVEAPTFSDIRLIDGGKVVSPTRRPVLPPERLLVLISVGGWVDPRAIVRLEELGKFKKSTSSGTRIGDLPACSIVPQPTTLPRAPYSEYIDILIGDVGKVAVVLFW
jgi:hypothetical protein